MEPDRPSGSYYLRLGFDPLVDFEGVTVWQHTANEEIWASRLGI